MFPIDRHILLGGALVLIGILSSKFSARLGLPVLVLFLGVGMLAGEDGIGRIAFDDFNLAHEIGTIALALILFDGGLQTRVPALRESWKPSLLLATVGVLITALITGAVAARVLHIPFLTGLLLGSIIASTDAAAVFSVLRLQQLRLRHRIVSTLEIESGSNDPMAVFLTIGVVEIMAGRMDPGWGLLWFFLRQMGIGALVGVGAGAIAVRLVNRISLAAPGLYPLLAGTCGLLAYGLAATLHGSGFLAIYAAGIVVGNSRLVFQRGTFLFMDALAWMGQIVMFVVLGLLSTPSQLIPVAGEALIITAVLVFVARPVAVIPLLAACGFSLREQVFIAWVGLKGSVPIILATFPLMFGVPDARLLFDVVFFVVLVSAMLQGWTIPWLASRLGLEEADAPPPAVSLELMALSDVSAEVLDYAIAARSTLAGRTVASLRLPEGAIVAMISRGRHLIPPRGSTLLLANDHVFVITRADVKPDVDRAFCDTNARS